MYQRNMPENVEQAGMRRVSLNRMKNQAYPVGARHDAAVDTCQSRTLRKITRRQAKILRSVRDVVGNVLARNEQRWQVLPCDGVLAVEFISPRCKRYHHCEMRLRRCFHDIII